MIEKPSEEERQRVWELVKREKTEGLSEAETSELQHYLRLEHVMRLRKARIPRDGGSASVPEDPT